MAEITQATKNIEVNGPPPRKKKSIEAREYHDHDFEFQDVVEQGKKHEKKVKVWREAYNQDQRKRKPGNVLKDQICVPEEIETASSVSMQLLI